MKKQDENIENSRILRQKAEELLRTKQAKSILSYTEADTLKLFHELQVHQVELEMINEKLVLANREEYLAKERYKDLYDFSPSGYLTLTNECEIKELNFVAAQMLGKERSRLINSCFDFFISVDTRVTFNNFFKSICSGSIKQSCDVIIATEGNQPIHVNINGIADKINNLCLLAIIDISKLKQIEQNLLIAKDKAEESDRLKSAFLANMSHEIRTPMNGILGFAKLLRMADLAGEKQTKYIQIIEESGTRMLNIINNIISISKIESGLMDVNLSESNINEQIQYIYTFFKPAVESKGMQLIHNNKLPECLSFIRTDKEKLFGIFINLVKNAIKYSDKGSIEIGCDKKGDYLLFHVKDSGIGIDCDRQEAIFERFVQADISDKHAYQGAGLGLSISKAYVEMLGGKLWVESEIGIGSTFYFTIPYTKDIDDSSHNLNEKYVCLSDNHSLSLKILIVEDDDTSAELLRITLDAYASEIISVKNGKDAVDTFRKNLDFDLVLMDIQLLDMTGYEVTKQIRKSNNSVVIIAQTAYGLAGDREKSLTAGCNDYISKPIDKNALLTLIRKYFKNVNF